MFEGGAYSCGFPAACKAIINRFSRHLKRFSGSIHPTATPWHDIGFVYAEWEINKKRMAIFRRFRQALWKRDRRTPIPPFASQECSLAWVRKKTPCHGFALDPSTHAQTTFLSEIALSI
jgi:hypothetical protein